MKNRTRATGREGAMGLRQRRPAAAKATGSAAHGIPPRPRLSLLMLACAGLAPGAWAGDWPMWGGTPERNMVSQEQGLPERFGAGQRKAGSEEVDLASTENVRWTAKLGSQAYGNPTIAGGRVFVGTNNESPRDKRYEGDRGVLICLEERTGQFLWQLVVPKLGAGKVSDWEFLGICSSPQVEGERVYVITNRCEVLCLDVKGQADGNEGPFQDEGYYLAGLMDELNQARGEKNEEALKGLAERAFKPGPGDADILWRFDMRDELGIFPHNITSSSVLILGDLLYATTSNGMDWSHVNIPAPNAPCLAVLDKTTGKYLGEEASGIGQRMLHCNWSSPACGRVGAEDMVFFGAGDGFCYAFESKPVPGPDGLNVLKERWRFDCNPPEYRQKDGKKIKYPSHAGPSELIATPVFYKGRVYVATGQDPEHGEGAGSLSCIDATQRGEISASGLVWRNTEINRTIATVAIQDDLLYAADYAGVVRCFDALTGKLHWKHESGSHIWSSCLVADGRVYVGTEEGDLLVLQAGKEKKLLDKVAFGSEVYASPVAANGVLYVCTQTHLFAIGKK